MKRALLFLAGLLTYAFAFATALAQPSGFIDPPAPALTPAKDITGVSTWEKPGFNRADYNRVMVDAITIFLSPKSEYKGIEPDQLKALADGFHAELVKALGDKYPVVNKAEKGVLRARIAITNVSVKKKQRGALSFLPVGMVVTAVNDAAGKNILLVDARVEAELTDALSGERLQVLVDSDPMKRAGAKPHEESWAALQARLKEYAARFRQRMDESRAKP